ncbi:TraA family conjugative transfer protein [Marinobacter sp. F3R08]|uniref:TraA family conjugative transfer protein n=1 Tax=Marinobacter sp. F3R08 TaxID=2841559 RepID=UPI001C08DC0F|nr:TraA family conjugative transfer protein [Marinobacter sp. F3R08]MBU2952239.1 TrbC/VirB2 family protein [Marinobacter sp. F3R08]
MTRSNKMNSTAMFAFALMASAVFVLTPDTAFAGTGGASFEPVWNDLKEWMQGTLGRIIAAAIVVVGIIAGVARQSLMAFAIGLFGGFGLYYTPDVLENIVTATIEHVGQVNTAVMVISNGL